MRLIVCCLLCLMTQIYPGQAVDLGNLTLANRDKVKPVLTKPFLDALAAEYQRVAALPPNQRPVRSSNKRQAALQMSAFRVILSEADRLNIPQNSGYLSVRFIVEHYVQDVLGQPLTTDPQLQRQQSDDAADYLISVAAEADRIESYAALPSKISPKSMIDRVAGQLATTELTVRSESTGGTGPPTFEQIQTTQQYTRALDQLIERYDREFAKAEKLTSYKSAKSMGMSLFVQTSNAVNALSDAAKASAQRANGLYDIGTIPATAMPLSEYDDRRADEQEEEAEP
jgi:hypothetical protein